MKRDSPAGGGCDGGAVGAAGAALAFPFPFVSTVDGRAAAARRGGIGGDDRASVGGQLSVIVGGWVSQSRRASESPRHKISMRLKTST